MRGPTFALASFLLCAAVSADPADEDPTGVVVGIEDLHPTVRSASGGFLLELKGFVQLDGRSVSWEDAAVRDFDLRRARVKAEGELFHFLEYELDVDVSEREEPVRDAYVNAVVSDALQIRVGKAKLPFSQEELRSSRFLDFAERPSMNNLIPDRALGVEIHGELEDGRVAYQTGVFGVAAASSGGHELFGRLRLRPFASGPLEKLFVGGSLGRGELSQGESFQGRPGSRSLTFFEPVPVSGAVAHDNLEAAWFHRSVSLHTEWIRTRFERRGLSDADVIGRGFELGGAWIVTGEPKGERGIAPRRSVLSGGPGAWEIVARYEWLSVDDGAALEEERALVLGTNWWLSRSLRFVLDVSFDRIGAQPEPVRQIRARTVLARVQVIF